MVVGHVGVAFAARALKRDAPLAWLVAASIAPDLIDFWLRAREICNEPGVYSHSLPVIGVLAGGFGLAAFWRTRDWKIASVAASLVLAHVVCDYVTGAKVLWPGGPVFGLEMYRWPWLDFLIELPLIYGGWWMLRRAERWRVWSGSRPMLLALLSLQGLADLGIQNIRSGKQIPCVVETPAGPRLHLLAGDRRTAGALRRQAV